MKIHWINDLPELQCIATGCKNTARYDGCWCGICDLRFNNGKGKRKINLLTEQKI